MAKSFSPLPLYLAVAYTLLAIYGSLYPFADWHDSGAPLTGFLTAGWPRYTTSFDVGANIAAYLPLGFLWVTALRRRMVAPLAISAAVLIGVALSFCMEVVQHYLPSRVPSNLDLLCNSIGTLIGALAGGRWGRAMLDGGRLDRLRQRLFTTGSMPDAGLLLIWLWLLTQFNPDTLLFGNGGLRALLDVSAPLDYSAGAFVRIEAAIVASNTLAIALLVTLLARPGLPVLAPGVVGLALLCKSFAFLLMMGGHAGLAWATPGSLLGLGIGIVLWLLSIPLQARWQRALAALSLLVATTLVNIAPENPYLANTIQLWNPGQFLNFHGLTRLASHLWPFLALPWLILMKAEHER